MFDKFKSCKDLETGEDCPDRTAQPNCHSTCEGYLHRCEVNQKIRDKRQEQFEQRLFCYEARASREKYFQRRTKR